MEFIVTCLKVLWALPWTAFGCSFGLLAVLTGGGYRRNGIVLEFWGGLPARILARLPILGGAAAITFGHSILACTWNDLVGAREHELVHVRQYERWGPAFIPAYLLGSIWPWLSRRSAYFDNPFERETYDSGPPSLVSCAVWKLVYVTTWLVALGCGIAVLAGTLSSFDWRADLAVHFQSIYALALGACAIVFWVHGSFRLALFWLCFALLPASKLAPYLWPEKSAREVRLSSAEKQHASAHGHIQSGSCKAIVTNVFTKNPHHELVLTFLQEQRADFVAALEINAKWLASLERLASDYPYREFESREDNFGIAFLSRHPFESSIRLTTPASAVPFIGVRTTVHGTKMLIVALHVLPPVGPARSAARNRDLVSIVEWIEANRHDHAVIVMGDFNCTPWSPHFQIFSQGAQLHDCRLGFGVLGSWPSHLPIVRLPIDHILVSDGWRTDGCLLGPNVGSDHLPLIVELSRAY